MYYDPDKRFRAKYWNYKTCNYKFINKAQKRKRDCEYQDFINDITKKTKINDIATINHIITKGGSRTTRKMSAEPMEIGSPIRSDIVTGSRRSCIEPMEIDSPVKNGMVVHQKLSQIYMLKLLIGLNVTIVK